MIDHQATWRIQVSHQESPGSRPGFLTAIGGIATGLAIPGLLWWLLTLIIETTDELAARPWTLPPRPPPILAPTITIPRTIVEMPCVIEKSITVAAVPRKKRGKVNARKKSDVQIEAGAALAGKPE